MRELLLLGIARTDALKLKSVTVYLFDLFNTQYEAPEDNTREDSILDPGTLLLYICSSFIFKYLSPMWCSSK